MYRRNLALWCCILLFATSFSELRGNSTAGDDERSNSTIQYKIQPVTITSRSNDAETMRYNKRENSTGNDDVQYELHNNSTSDERKNNGTMQYDIHVQSTENHEGDKMLMELRANFTKTDDNSTSHEFGENLMQIEDGSNLTLYELSERFYHDDKKIVVPYETCKNSTCILLCCPPGDRFINDKCRPGNNHIPLPEVYTMNDTTERTGKTLDQVFLLAVNNPCKFDRYLLDPDLSLSDQYMFLDNGSLYRPYATINLEENAVVYYPVGVLISMPCLLATFVVYSVLPELRNMHGYTLRGYVGSLFVAYTFLAVIQLDRSTAISHTVCITFGTAYNKTINAAYNS